MQSGARQELVRRRGECPVGLESMEPELIESFRKMKAVHIAVDQCFLNVDCFLRKDMVSAG